MKSCNVFFIALFLLVHHIIGIPLRFPDDSSDSREVVRTLPVSVEGEARFHHLHKKKLKKKKHGCGGGHHLFKRATQQGRFLFPILNIYDTDINLINGGSNGKPGCGVNFLGGGGGGILGSTGGGGGGILGSTGGGSAAPLQGITSAISSGITGITSSVSDIASTLGSGFNSLTQTLGNGFGGLGSGILGGGGENPLRPPIFPSITPAPVTEFPEPPVNPFPITSVITPSPIFPTPAPVAPSTDDGDDGDYDYSNFGSSESPPSPPMRRPRPGRPYRPASSYGSGNSGVRPYPSFGRPGSYFNQYVVRPIDKTIREFYSLF